jgi:signal transduction histidine kinase
MIDDVRRAKYAGATVVTIRLSETNGSVMFEIEDDGHGFDPSRTGYGTGLQGMADRLEAMGGTLQVQSAPGRGTVVRGLIGLGGR